MPEKFANKEIEQLLAEADALIQKINADALEDMQAEDRIQFEAHAQRLKQLRSEAREASDPQNKQTGGTYAQGMHEAIEDIVKAMKNLADYLT